jgi:TPR repeat protein
VILRISLLLLVLLLPSGLLTAQQNPGSKQDGCALFNRLKAMSPSEFMELLTKGQAGDAAAQNQVGSAYEIGGPVPRDDDEAERWLLKSAEQHYAPQVGHALDDEAKTPGQVQAVLSMTHLSEAD